MSSESNESVKCGNCGYIFQGNDIDQKSGERKPCPKCGSLKRIFYPEVKDTLIAHDCIGLEAKKPGTKHKKNRADYEEEKGVRKGKDGKLVFVRKIKDREHPELPDSYVEYVRDKDGNIIVNKSEKLSEHIESKRGKL
jgi:predicted  nucleic acid-binding Zn-ribbon protein